MFSGIIESMGKVVHIEKEQTNIHFTIQHHYTDPLYIDQSIAHDGCCLTVVSINEDENTYIVTAIEETLKRTALNHWTVGRLVNLERCIKADARLDGHFVQGHVDGTVQCLKIEDKDGSWVYTFELPDEFYHLVVQKGSIAISGTSLTVILNDQHANQFQVAIIPYTYNHTSFHQMKQGDIVNIEFDILGKYIARLKEKR